MWDDRTRSITIANAGSVQPLLVRNVGLGVTVETIRTEGFPLGLFPKAEYDEITLKTSPGDLIVFFSDGIVDAVNADGEMFGSERLAAVLEAHPGACASAQEAVKAVLKAVAAFQNEVAHFDDETLVILRVV